MISKVLFSLPFILILFSCENNIDVIDEVESKPVVYSLLDLSDTVYSVSLTRTFLDEKGIYQLIGDPKVVYFPSANITLEGLEGDSCIWSTNFFKTDVVKDEGIFPRDPGYLYFSESVIKEFDEFGFLSGPFRNIDNFRLSVKVPEDNIIYTASAPVYYPNFVVLPRNGSEISLYESEELEIMISSWPKPAAYNQLNFRIRYYEKNNATNELQQKEIEYIVRKKYQYKEIENSSIISADFFLNKLAANIPYVEDLQYRKFKDFDIILYSADGSFNTYRETYDYASDLAQPIWSNIESGIGIFSLLFSYKVKGLIIDQKTRDSIAFSPITRKLKFVRWE